MIEALVAFALICVVGVWFAWREDRRAAKTKHAQ